MSPEDLDRLAQELSLASMLTGYPDEEFEVTCESMQARLRLHPGARALSARLGTENGYDDLRGHYIELFDRGKERISLYETEYGRMRGMSKGNGLADISGFYRAFGLVLDHEAAQEMRDHVAVELEFFAFMTTKQAHLLRQRDRTGVEIVQEARGKFLAEHLGALVEVVHQRLERRGDDVYGPLFAWLAHILSAECLRLGVTPLPLEELEDPELEEQARCARSLPVLQ